MINVMDTKELMEVNGGCYKYIPCYAHDDRGILRNLGWDAWRDVPSDDPAVCFIDGRKSTRWPWQ